MIYVQRYSASARVIAAKANRIHFERFGIIAMVVTLRLPAFAVHANEIGRIRKETDFHGVFSYGSGDAVVVVRDVFTDGHARPNLGAWKAEPGAPVSFPYVGSALLALCLAWLALQWLACLAISVTSVTSSNRFFATSLAKIVHFDRLCRSVFKQLRNELLHRDFSARGVTDLLCAVGRKATVKPLGDSHRLNANGRSQSFFGLEVLDCFI
jgi:hypothetical protein